MSEAGRDRGRLLLGRIVRPADLQPLGRQAQGCLLLNHMHQFVGKEPTSGAILRSPACGAKDDVVPHRESVGVDRSSRLSRAITGVHTNLAEVVAEVRLHHGAGRHGQRLVRRSKNSR